MDFKITVFFHGSYINLNELKEVDIVPETFELARLDGLDISIRPRANLFALEKAMFMAL